MSDENSVFETNQLAFAREQLERVQCLIAESTGLDEITGKDGKSIKFTDLLKQRDYWQGEIRGGSGARPVASRIDLSGF